MKRNFVQHFVDCIGKIMTILYNFFGRILVTSFLVEKFDVILCKSGYEIIS